MSIKDKKIIIFDGICLLCNQAVYFLHKRLRYQNYKFIPSQSKEGEILISEQNLEKTTKESIVLITESGIFTKSDAILEIISDLPIGWQMLKIIRLIPKKIRNLGYDVVSKNRHLFFGKI